MVEGEGYSYNQYRHEEEKPRKRIVEQMRADVSGNADVLDAGVAAIRQKFQSTPIAEALEDLPEGITLPASTILSRIDKHLNRARKHIFVEEGNACRREVTMDWMKQRPIEADEYTLFDQDRKHRRELVAAAAPVRQAVAAAVPGLQLNEENRVNLTPVVKNDRQLILLQTRSYYVHEPQEVVRILEEQYTVLEQSVDLTWQQRGSLPSLTIETFPEDPDDMEDNLYNALIKEQLGLYSKDKKLDKIEKRRPLTKMEKALREELMDRICEVEWQQNFVEAKPTERHSRVLPNPFPLVYFNPGTADQHDELGAYYTGEDTEIYAPLPPAFDFPEPTSSSSARDSWFGWDEDT